MFKLLPILLIIASFGFTGCTPSQKEQNENIVKSESLNKFGKTIQKGFHTKVSLKEKVNGIDLRTLVFNIDSIDYSENTVNLVSQLSKETPTPIKVKTLICQLTEVNPNQDKWYPLALDRCKYERFTKLENTEKSPPPKLSDLLNGTAFFDNALPTGLQMGESDTLLDDANNQLVSFGHHGKVHSETAMADFVGCATKWADSTKSGNEFTMANECIICQSNSDRCHMRQQQYPRLVELGDRQLLMVFERQAGVRISYSSDFGITWTMPSQILGTGQGACQNFGSKWPNTSLLKEGGKDNICLVGAPPGTFADLQNDILYLYFSQGSAPATLGCMKATLSHTVDALKIAPATINTFQPCHTNGDPILQTSGRYFSSVDIVEEDGRYYLTAEIETLDAAGHRWQLVFAHSDKLDSGWSLKNQLDFPFESEPRPDIGLGHGDLIKVENKWYLFTSDGYQKNRLRYELIWK